MQTSITFRNIATRVRMQGRTLALIAGEEGADKIFWMGD